MSVEAVCRRSHVPAAGDQLPATAHAAIPPYNANPASIHHGTGLPAPMNAAVRAAKPAGMESIWAHSRGVGEGLGFCGRTHDHVWDVGRAWT